MRTLLFKCVGAAALFVLAGGRAHGCEPCQKVWGPEESPAAADALSLAARLFSLR